MFLFRVSRWLIICASICLPISKIILLTVQVIIIIVIAIISTYYLLTLSLKYHLIQYLSNIIIPTLLMKKSSKFEECIQAIRLWCKEYKNFEWGLTDNGWQRQSFKFFLPQTVSLCYVPPKYLRNLYLQFLNLVL